MKKNPASSFHHIFSLICAVIASLHKEGASSGMIINVSFHRGHIIQYLSTILSMTFLLFSVSIVASCKDLAWCIVQDGTNFYAILFIFMPINMSAGMLCFRSFLAHQRLSTRMPNSTTFNPHFARTPSEIAHKT